MNMKISLENLGVLTKADFTLGDLTIICGKNNTGKTYATYALYGFLDSWRQYISIPVDNSVISSLGNEGTVKIDLVPYVLDIDNLLRQACQKYAAQLSRVFAAAEDRFLESEFCIQLTTPDIQAKEFEEEIGWPERQFLLFSKEKGREDLTVTLVPKEEEERSNIDTGFASLAIRLMIREIVFSDSFPNSFISSAERTGVAIFRTELNFARNRLLKDMEEADDDVDPRSLLSKGFQRYPRPVEANIEFAGQLENIAKSKSFIAHENSEVLESFSDIISGDYHVTQRGQLYFIPQGTQLRLTMVESSSAVRSLVDLGFYLRYVAKKGDLLIVDEPELNLHPENQRRIARLFARLVNLGIKVFVTTHSDYIVKELNTLIMLNHDKPHLGRIAAENGYQDAELINSDQVKVFLTQADPSEEGQGGHTLIPADIDSELGIEARSFDETIDEMNRIMEDIIWGTE